MANTKELSEAIYQKILIQVLAWVSTDSLSVDDLHTCSHITLDIRAAQEEALIIKGNQA